MTKLAGTYATTSLDISTIGLRDLRTKVAIIPQDVSLFLWSSMFIADYVLSPCYSVVRIIF